MVRSEVDTRGEMEQFILRPSQLRPQCGRNWIHPIELSAALQLPHSESTTIQRLYFFRQITDDVLAVVRARPIGGLRLLDHGQDVAKDVILRSMQDYQELISENHRGRGGGKPVYDRHFASFVTGFFYISRY